MPKLFHLIKYSMFNSVSYEASIRTEIISNVKKYVLKVSNNSEFNKNYPLIINFNV